MAGATTLGDLASAIGVRSQEEAAIVAELKAGSEAAYTWLIGEFQQPVYGLVYRMVNDPADAADTTQDVFLKVFRGIKHFHGESSLKTWIYRIALHEESVAHHEVQQRVEQELRKVPEPYRTTLILRDLEEMSYEEIAEVLQVSLGTVKSRLTRGREALRQRLTSYVREVGSELGLTAPEERDSRSQVTGGGRRAEVMP